MADPRVKVAIAMSAPVNIPQRQDGSAFAAISIPVLHLTGSEDRSPISTTTPADRRIPFDNAKRAPAILLTFNGADHMSFAKHRRADDAASDQKFHTFITELSVTFLDAYLRGDAGAKEWLGSPAVKNFLGSVGKIEEKL